MLLRYLETYKLYHVVKQKQTNGSTIDTYELLGSYRVQKQDLATDEVASSIYGADINSIYRISSVLGELEAYLLPKVSNKEDNISKYLISKEVPNTSVGEIIYKIRAVSEDRIDIQRIWNQ